MLKVIKARIAGDYKIALKIFINYDYEDQKIMLAESVELFNRNLLGFLESESIPEMLELLRPIKEILGKQLNDKYLESMVGYKTDFDEKRQKEAIKVIGDELVDGRELMN